MLSFLELDLSPHAIFQIVRVHNADYVSICRTLKQDVVFMDPPWGGPAYKDTAALLDLYLGPHRLADVCKSVVPVVR